MSDDVKKRLAEIETRANATPKGPWHFELKSFGYQITTDLQKGHATFTFKPEVWNNPMKGQKLHDWQLEAIRTGEFVAHSREDVPFLLGALKTEREAREKAEAEVEIARRRLGPAGWKMIKEGEQAKAEVLRLQETECTCPACGTEWVNGDPQRMRAQRPAPVGDAVERERAKVLQRVRETCAELAEVHSGPELARVRAVPNNEVCTLLDIIDGLREELKTSDQIIAERNRILQAHPCPVHGQCVPHVLEVLKSHEERTRIAEEVLSGGYQQGMNGLVVDRAKANAFMGNKFPCRGSSEETEGVAGQAQGPAKAEVERQIPNLEVGGSSPSPGAKKEE